MSETIDVKTALIAINSSLTIDGTEYNVLEPVPSGSALVAKARIDLMNNINLERVLVDIDRVNDLIFVASCGVAGYGTDLGAKISRLQYKLLEACTDGIMSMIVFKDQAEGIVTFVTKAYKEIYRLREDKALVYLQHCAGYASKMAATAGALADKFKNLADSAQEALEDTLNEQTSQEQARIAALKRKAEVEALDKEARALKDALVHQMRKVQILYDEAKAAQHSAENRAFMLAVVGSITSAIGSGVAAYAAASPAGAVSNIATALTGSMSQQPKGSSSASDIPPNASEPSAPTKPKAEPTPVSAVGKSSSQAETAKPPETEVKNTKAGVQEGEKGGKDSKQEPATTKAAEAAPELSASAKGNKALFADTAIKKGAVAAGSDLAAPNAPGASGQTAAGAQTKPGIDGKAAAAAIAAGADNVARSTQQMSGSYNDIAANYTREKAKYLDLLLEMQTQERQALGAIAKYAEQMKAFVSNADAAQAAVDSLQQAVAALKQIVTILETAKLFWQIMAQACERLADEKLTRQIKIHLDDDPAFRVEEWSDPMFKKQMLGMAAQWVALHQIASEYQNAMAAQRGKVIATINKGVSITEARKLAPQLAGELAAAVERDLASLDGAEASLKTERAKLVAPDTLAA